MAGQLVEMILWLKEARDILALQGLVVTYSNAMLGNAPMVDGADLGYTAATI